MYLLLANVKDHADLPESLRSWHEINRRILEVGLLRRQMRKNDPVQAGYQKRCPFSFRLLDAYFVAQSSSVLVIGYFVRLNVLLFLPVLRAVHLEEVIEIC